MGIPFYFKNLLSRHHDIVYPASTAQGCISLYLDFNCIVHQCAHMTVSQRENAQLDIDALSEIIIGKSIDYVEFLRDIIRPTELLYIAVDGPCPRAKLVQQRRRRFVSAWKQEKLTPILEKMGWNTAWDSNIITPGTEFMDKLNIALANYTNQPHKGTKSVQLSDSTEFGEGEHKIFEVMQNVSTSASDVQFVYGLDADLIMLSLMSNFNIHLIREIPEFQIPIQVHPKERFLCLNVPILKTSIYEAYGGHTFGLSKDIFVQDYVMLCTLLGNDFVPSLSFLKIKHHAIDMLMIAYTKVVQQYGGLQTLVDTAKGELNALFIRTLLDELAKQEDNHMKEMNSVYFSKRAKPDPKANTPLQQASFELDNLPSFHKSGAAIDPNTPGWRMRYYETLFGSHAPQFITHVCNRYTEGLNWVLRYYTSHNAPLDWHYEFIYSPSILDLSNYFHTLNDEPLPITRGLSDDEYRKAMNTPYVQLLMVLPPQSASLVSERLRPLMRDPEHGCVHYYPLRFQISTYLKFYLWECSPLLPSMDLQHLYKMVTDTHQPLKEMTLCS